MALQLALTTLESLAEMLNERKREAEQFAAFRDKMRNISGKFTTNVSRTLSAGSSPSSLEGGAAANRFLLKEDDMTQLVRKEGREEEKV
jgi:Rho guanine nucleotide exchange factor 10